MIIAPVINCPTVGCFKKRIKKVASFLAPKALVHIDFSDDKTTGTSSCIDLPTIKEYTPRLSFVLHAMVEPTLLQKEELQKAPWGMLLIHWALWDKVAPLWRAQGKKIGCVVNFDDDISSIQLPQDTDVYEILAVTPGPSGQKTQKNAYDMISFLKKERPDATLLVDGGVNENTIGNLHTAGANAFAVGSAIWDADDPKAAYKTLSSL